MSSPVLSLLEDKRKFMFREHVWNSIDQRKVKHRTVLTCLSKYKLIKNWDLEAYIVSPTTSYLKIVSNNRKKVTVSALLFSNPSKTEILLKTSQRKIEEMKRKKAETFLQRETADVSENYPSRKNHQQKDFVER